MHQHPERVPRAAPRRSSLRLPYAALSLAYVLDRFGPRLARGSRRLLYAGIASWLVAASAFTLSTRYATPSGYVLKRVRVFERYL